MTRISSLFVATTLAVLPLSAFAQQNAMSGKDTSPSSKSSMAPVTTPIAGKTTTTMPTSTTGTSTPPVTAPLAGKTTTTTMPTSTTGTSTMPTSTATTNTTGAVTPEAKSGAKTAVPGTKTEQHSMNTVTSHHAKAATPAKIAAPAKS